MRTKIVFHAAVFLFILAVGTGEARAQIDKPWGVGVGIGVMTYGSFVDMFSLEVPLQYSFEVGPGELTASVGFLLGVGELEYLAIGVPVGARYKMRILQKYPLYAYGLFDAGLLYIPSRDVGLGLGSWGLGGVSAKSASMTGGFVRFGGGVTYFVHESVELFLQPLGLGGVFFDEGSEFSYSFTTGAMFRF